VKSPFLRGVISVLSVNHHPYRGVISVLGGNQYPFIGVISAQGDQQNPSNENNFPLVAFFF